jgi:hypothetical protein
MKSTPKFQVGDKVAPSDDKAIKSDSPYRDFAAEHKGKVFVVLDSFPLLKDDEKLLCFLAAKDGTICMCPENVLELVEKRIEPKFKPGEWVKVSELVNGLIPEDMFMFYRRRFMKVKSIKYSSGWLYSVKENSKLWHEDWLEKVE